MFVKNIAVPKNHAILGTQAFIYIFFILQWKIRICSCHLSFFLFSNIFLNRFSISKLYNDTFSFYTVACEYPHQVAAWRLRVTFMIFYNRNAWDLQAFLSAVLLLQAQLCFCILDPFLKYRVLKFSAILSEDSMTSKRLFRAFISLIRLSYFASLP